MSIKLKIDGNVIHLSHSEALQIIHIGEELKKIGSLKSQALYGALPGTQTMIDRTRGPGLNYTSQAKPPSITVEVLADC
ncbi:hypothetical protein D9M68_330010 [compost metagenome]